MTRRRVAACAKWVLCAIVALVLWPSPSAIAVPAPLIAEFVVSKPASKEGAKFTISLVVSNTGPDTIANVSPANLEVTGTGGAALAKWPKPATATIRAGGRVTFKLGCVATLRGNVQLQATATSDAGDSLVAVSSQIVVAPRKSGTAATTTDLGDGTLRIGKASLPVILRDQKTGNPIAGLAIAFAADKKVKSRGVVAVLDPLGRYPPQWFRLSGPRSASARKASGPVAPVDLSVRGPCRNGDPLLRVVAPIETFALPQVKPPGAPPSPDLPDTAADETVTVVAAVKAALMQAVEAAKGIGGSALNAGVRSGLVTRETVTCEDAWQKDLDAMDALAVDQLVGMVVDDPRPVLACSLLGPASPACLGAVAAIGTAGKVSQVVDRWRLGSFCPSPTRRDVVTRYQLDLHLPPGLEFLGSDIYAHVGPAVDSYAALFPINTFATDRVGLPLTSGSLELVSFTDAGLGIVAPLDGDGVTNFDVPPGDYRWCVNSPGHEPETGDVTVTGPGTTDIRAALAPLPVASVVLAVDGLTGFLAPGTTRQMTATFFDAKGQVVDCTGRVRWYAVNPVGTVVATVDTLTGLVTMQSGCGAALVVASCEGVSSRPGRLFSTDCKGTLPPKPPKPGGGGGGPRTFTGSFAGSAFYSGTNCDYTHAIAADMTLTVSGSGTDSAPYEGSWSIDCTDTVTQVQTHAGSCFTDDPFPSTSGILGDPFRLDYGEVFGVANVSAFRFVNFTGTISGDTFSGHVKIQIGDVYNGTPLERDFTLKVQ